MFSHAEQGLFQILNGGLLIALVFCDEVVYPTLLLRNSGKSSQSLGAIPTDMAACRYAMAEGIHETFLSLLSDFEDVSPELLKARNRSICELNASSIRITFKLGLGISQNGFEIRVGIYTPGFIGGILIGTQVMVTFVLLTSLHCERRIRHVVRHAFLFSWWTVPIFLEEEL